MDHTGLNFLIFLFVLGPLVIFFVKALQAAGPARKAIEADDSYKWKDPDLYLVNVPSEMVTKIVAETLPQFHYANGNWQIINIEPGMPTTIAANLPCLDESDPANVQRFDLGLITTIIDQSASGQATRVKMHFIPYEGLDGGLEEMSRQTYIFIQKALRARDGLMQPLVVQGDDDSLPSDGAPAERPTKFFMQSAAKGGFEKDDRSIFEGGDTSNSSDIDTGDLDVVPSAPQPKWQQASVPEFMPEYHDPSDEPGPSPTRSAPANENVPATNSSSANEFMPGYVQPQAAPASEFMPEYDVPAQAVAPDFSTVPEMAEVPDFAPVPEQASAPDPFSFLNQGPAISSMSAPLFDPAPFEVPPAPTMPTLAPAIPIPAIPAPPAIPVPPVMPAPPAMPSAAPPTMPSAAPPIMPSAAPPTMPSAAPPTMPSGFPTTASGSMYEVDSGSGTSSGGGNTAGLCPGCSQPINPSFPFCLYCGKNF